MLCEWPNWYASFWCYSKVLILILMEYALWEKEREVYDNNNDGLNPYSNGICSVRTAWSASMWSLQFKVLILILMEYALWEQLKLDEKGVAHGCLNPYSNGICSVRGQKCWGYSKNTRVLILILMEYALWVDESLLAMCEKASRVLILILMEYALWECFYKNSPDYGCLNPYSNGICSRQPRSPSSCLNPYSNGICSMRFKRQHRYRLRVSRVLILILMEYALWALKTQIYYLPAS